MTQIKAITYDDALILVRKEIISFTGIASALVINATSIRGPDVVKMINTQISISPDLSNTFIVFEMTENQDEVFGATQQDDSVQGVVMPYDFNLKIYGTKCHEYADKILADFRLPKTVTALWDEGVWVYGVSRPESVNEIINNTVWPRCDLHISFETRLDVAISDKIYVEGSIDDVNIIKAK
jgi:hypothetical protein